MGRLEVGRLGMRKDEWWVEVRMGKDEWWVGWGWGRMRSGKDERWVGWRWVGWG